jgi:hypothetical protein
MKRFFCIAIVWLLPLATCWGADLTMTVDTAVTVPVNIFPLIDDTDGKTREDSVLYDAGIDLTWNFVTTAGVMSQTPVTPTASGNYVWTAADMAGDGMYKIAIPASSGGSVNNDTAGIGWFTGVCDGVLPWRGPTVAFVPANVADSEINGTDYRRVDAAEGYNNVLHVGSGHTYASIAHAQTAAAAGDLVIIHAGTYTDVGIGKLDVTYYAEPGVDLTGTSSSIFDGSVARFKFLGHAAISRGSGSYGIYAGGATVENVEIEWDRLRGGLGNSADAFQITGAADSRVRLFGRQTIATGSVNFVTLLGGAHVFLEGDTLTGGSLFLLTDGGAKGEIHNRVKKTKASAIVNASSDSGRLIIRSAMQATGGLNIPIGPVAICIDGSITDFTGSASLAGSGEIYVSSSFAYNTNLATATNIIATTPEKIRTDAAAILSDTNEVQGKLPSKSFIAGTNNSDGGIEADEMTGSFPGSVASVTGSVGSIGTGGITAASIADNAIDAGAIAAGAIVNGTEATGWNDLSTTQVNGEVKAALADINLDHLMKNALAGGEITSNSALAKLAASDGNWTSFVNADESLQAQRENIDAILDGAPTFAQAMDDHEYTSSRAMKLDNLDMPVSEVRNETPSLLLSTMINGTPASNTSLVLADGPSTDGGLVGALVIITDGSVGSQKAVGLVKNYDHATNTLTLVTDPGIFTFADGDQIDVIATGSPAALWLGGSP